MVQRLLRDLAVKLFGAVAEVGFRSSFFRRTFLALYSVYKHYLEAGPVDELRQFVPDGSVVIDTGANVGFFSQRFAVWVGTQGEAILLEPEDRNFDALRSMLLRKGLIGRTRLIKAAAAETSGKALFKVNPQHPGDHKLSVDDTGVLIDTVRLDELVVDRRDGRPSLIKIDVQGAELAVLHGASDILRQARPALFVELDENGLRKFGASVGEILNYLDGFGYGAFWLEKGGKLTAATQGDITARIARLGYVDVLFLSNGRSSGLKVCGSSN
jgi:FkbM family methyltransferase